MIQARKALRALKGLVKLQGIIRGWAVRLQALHTLKCLHTIVNIQSEFCAKKGDMFNTTLQEPKKDIKASEKASLALFYPPFSLWSMKNHRALHH